MPPVTGRTRSVGIRLTSAEYEAVSLVAKAFHLTRAQYIRLALEWSMPRVLNGQALPKITP
jgi:hypothetical protein